MTGGWIGVIARDRRDRKRPGFSREFTRMNTNQKTFRRRFSRMIADQKEVSLLPAALLAIGASRFARGFKYQSVPDRNWAAPWSGQI
jgi:hypothetical protein